MPLNLAAVKARLRDRTNYKDRIQAVDELASSGVPQSKDLLWRVMLDDLVYAVQKQAFLRLQAMGEKVRLPKKKPKPLIKNIEQMVGKVYDSLDRRYDAAEFSAKFQSMYPEAFDVYQYETSGENNRFQKPGEFDRWVQKVLKNLPRPKQG